MTSDGLLTLNSYWTSKIYLFLQSIGVIVSFASFVRSNRYQLYRTTPFPE